MFRDRTSYLDRNTEIHPSRMYMCIHKISGETNFIFKMQNKVCKFVMLLGGMLKAAVRSDFSCVLAAAFEGFSCVKVKNFRA